MAAHADVEVAEMGGDIADDVVGLIWVGGLDYHGVEHAEEAAHVVDGLVGGAVFADGKAAVGGHHFYVGVVDVIYSGLIFGAATHEGPEGGAEGNISI